jgi:hypothetical protein
MNAVERVHTGPSDANDEEKRRKSEEKNFPTAKVGTASITCVVFLRAFVFKLEKIYGEPMKLFLNRWNPYSQNNEKKKKN